MIAIIDVGSNSVRLMTWADGRVLYKQIATTRLGEGIASGVLCEQSMERTARAIATFYFQAKGEGAAEIYGFATAAVRSAKNGAEFVALVQERCNLDLDVVSGEEEAELGLAGALGSLRSGGIIDVGGASTEVCVRQNGKTAFKRSFNVGAVRLYNGCGQNYEKLTQAIEGSLVGLTDCPTEQFYAVGGTATTVAALELRLDKYDGGRIQGFPLTRECVERWAIRLCSLTQEERLALPGMDKKRADIIGGGALLLASVMKRIGLERVFVSDSDNLEGYLFRRVLK